VLFGAFSAIAVALYREALLGPFLSDDIAYLVTHPYTAPLSWRNVWEIFDPWGPAKLYAANYAPVHLLLTAVERHIFAEALLGYHLVNLFVHATNAVLLVAWLRRAGIADALAVAAGLFFLVHPANVEAVAWASQLKTNASLAFGLGALLALRRAPPAAAALFALSLLTKASGLFALPTAAVWLWADRDATRRDLAWLSLWVVIAVVYAVPQFASFAHLGQVEVEAYADLWVHVRTIAAVGVRYLLMAFTGIGVSAWQDPDPALSWLDPWWLAALPLGAVLGWRLIVGLRERRFEAVFWMAAAASFAPVSQIFPFSTPVADRYLYFILPGLLGGALLWARQGFERPRDWHPAPTEATRRLLVGGAAVAAAALIAGLGWQSAVRARIWQSETRMLLDSARHYPEGSSALVLRARSAAQAGDVASSVSALRAAADRGLDRFAALEQDPGLAPIRNTPEFRSLMQEIAGRWIAMAQRRGYSTQPELRFLAIAHATRGEYAEAVTALEGALAAGGPLDDVVRAELEATRAELAASGDGSGALEGGRREAPGQVPSEAPADRAGEAPADRAGEAPADRASGAPADEGGGERGAPLP
jgi:tetratricopeptide (TPR) repeat protein